MILSLKHSDGFFSDNYFDLIPVSKTVKLTVKNGQQVIAVDVMSYLVFDSYKKKNYKKRF
ncbi:hypothetical protein A5893_13070 [Pedobacter psychrophilus]|uniref:Beta-mannosidase Ig-fold domain-containing protein n=1 Tax=Pedobacter psychrophilus TaxID=1826909 RepID=A0A179DES3_9SPHI|nr:hypothetical protein A5893_13070 [Pedobacter psychrophilus]